MRHLLDKKDVEINGEQKWKDEYDSVIGKLYILSFSPQQVWLHALLQGHYFFVIIVKQH